MNESFIGARSELVSSGEQSSNYSLSEVIEKYLTFEHLIRKTLQKMETSLHMYLHKIERTANFSIEFVSLENNRDCCIFNCSLLFVTISCFITFP